METHHLSNSFQNLDDLWIALIIQVDIPRCAQSHPWWPIAGVTTRASTSWYVWKTEWCVSFALISVICCCRKQNTSLKTWMDDGKLFEMLTVSTINIAAFTSFCFSIFLAWAGLPRICDDSRRQGRKQQLQRSPALDEWCNKQQIVGLELRNPAWIKACISEGECIPADALNRIRIDKNLLG